MVVTTTTRIASFLCCLILTTLKYNSKLTFNIAMKYALFIVPYITFVKWATFEKFNEVNFAGDVVIHKNEPNINSREIVSS